MFRVKTAHSRASEQRRQGAGDQLKVSTSVRGYIKALKRSFSSKKLCVASSRWLHISPQGWGFPVTYHIDTFAAICQGNSVSEPLVTRNRVSNSSTFQHQSIPHCQGLGSRLNTNAQLVFRQTNYAPLKNQEKAVFPNAALIPVERQV